MRISVAGIPAPQGSKKHVGHGIMIEQSRAVGPWREAVRGETQRALMDGAWLAGTHQPVAVTITFYLARPKSAPKRVLYPATRPDLDKLIRSVLDGLQSGGAFHDDSQVVRLAARKVFCAPGATPGCLIELEIEG